MSRTRRRRSLKAGLPPGTVVHVGPPRPAPVRLSVYDYDGAAFEERELAGGAVEALADYRSRPTVTWVDVDGVHDTPLLERVGAVFGLHALLVEDVADTGQRAKHEDYGAHLYLALQMLRWDEAAHAVDGEQVSLVLGGGFLLSFQESKEGDLFDPVRARLRGDKGRARHAGADYLAYLLLDAVVDGYFVILDRLGDEVETLEELLLGPPVEDAIRRVHTLRQELVRLRRVLRPLREALRELAHGGSRLVRPETTPFLGDLSDHLVHAVDTLETYHELLNGMASLHLAQASNHLGRVMKLLAVISVFFMPLTFLAGVYGMNFKNIPGMDDPAGFWILLGGMVATALTMLVVFKRQKWF